MTRALRWTTTRGWRSLLVAAGFAALSAVLTWPWAIEAWGGGVDGDATQFVWDAWWVQERVFALESPWHTELLYAPEGTYLHAHPLETLLMVVVSPLTALAGPMVSYALLVLATLTAAGLLARTLGRALGLGEVGAPVAGILWAASPIVTHRTTTGFYMLLLLAALLPASVLLARRLVDRRTTGDAVLLGAFLGASLLTDLQVTMYVLAATGVVALYGIRTRAPWRTRSGFRLAAVTAVVCAVVGSPVLAVTLAAELDGDYRTPTSARVTSATAYNADLAQFVLPSPASRFFGEAYWRSADRLGDLSNYAVDGAVTLGWATLALAIVGLVATRGARRSRWLAAGVLVAIVLALGPSPKVLGHVYAPLSVDVGRPVSLVTPATWLLAVPVVNDLRIPSRWMQLGALPLVLLAGLGAAALARRGTAGLAAVGVLCTLAVAEGAVSLPADGPPGERLATTIRDDPREGVVVDVPLSWRSGILEIGSYEVSPRAMLWQTVHGRPIAAGYVARLDTAMLDRLLERPLYRALLVRQRNGEIPAGLVAPSTDEARADAELLRAHWVVVWPEADRGVLVLLEELGYRRSGAEAGVLLYSR